MSNVHIVLRLRSLRTRESGACVCICVCVHVVTVGEEVLHSITVVGT